MSDSITPLDSIPPAPGMDPRLGIGASANPSSPASNASLQPISGLDSLGFVMDVPVQVTVEIGRKSMKIGEILRLGPGSVLELEKANGEPLDIYVNDRLIARGEAVVVGERYGVRLTEVLVGDEVVTGSL